MGLILNVQQIYMYNTHVQYCQAELMGEKQTQLDIKYKCTHYPVWIVHSMKSAQLLTNTTMRIHLHIHIVTRLEACIIHQ